MKVLFPVEVLYPSQAGGAANSVYWLCKGLKKHGFETVLVSTDKGIGEAEKLNQWMTLDWGETIYIRTRHLNFPIWHTLVSLKRLVGADVLHVSSLFFPTAFATAFVARLLRKKLVWSVRGELAPKALLYSRFRKIPVLWFVRTFIGRYPLFHSTSDEETAYIKKNFGENAEVIQIRNFFEIPEVLPGSRSDYFLFLGRLHPIKGVENLIRAFALSRSFSESKMVLKIAGKGKGSYRASLEALVSELGLTARVEFVGHVEGDVKQRMLADAYFTVLPSHSENFGMVILESLALKTPVIASKGAPWKLLEEERIGFWTENSPEALSLAIDKALAIPEAVYEEYKERARGVVEREFDIERNMTSWLDLYKRVTERFDK